MIRIDTMTSGHMITVLQWDGLALMDISASSADEYEQKIKVLPVVSKEFSILKNKKKVEPAGFMFYVKYEIETVWENQKKGKSQNGKQIEEIFLYKDKINLLHEMDRRNNVAGINKEKKKRRTEDDDSESSNEDGHDEKGAKKKDKTFKKGTSLVKKYIADNIDIYDILGVEESDGLEKIKTNYKKLILIFHPDKSKGTTALHVEKKKQKDIAKAQINTAKEDSKNIDNQKKNEENDLMYYIEKYKVEHLSEEEKKTMFLKIQDAYTILSDADLRKQYDSSVPFDETIPTVKDLEASGNFYDFLKPIFKRNAKWSTIKPVPDLGDENTDIKTVKQFYDFWYSFTSWRDFSCQNEYDYEQAECREERRWMEKENKKIQKKASRLENLRIMKLVDLAFQRDPRLIAEKQRVQLEKQKRKEQQALIERQKKLELFNQTANKKVPLTNNSNNTDVTINVNDINSHLSGKEKMALKIWKHHIKSVCYIKLANYVKTDMLAQKLMTIPFDIMCDFIHDIYVTLNFDFNNFDEISQERRNQRILKMNEQGMKQNECNGMTKNETNCTVIPKPNGNINEKEKLNEKEIINMVNSFKMNGEETNQNDTSENMNNTKYNNSKKGNGKSNTKYTVNKKNTYKNKNKNSNQKNSMDSNRSAGFLDLIKNKQLNEQEIHALIQVFKKYITDSNFINGGYITPTKENANVSQIQKEEAINECTVQKTENVESSVSTDEKKHISVEKKDQLNDQEHRQVETSLKKLGTEELMKDKKKQSEHIEETNNNNSLKWSASEISLLSKALITYPGGTKDRWNLIANCLKNKNVKDVIKKTREMFENDTLKNLGKKFDETPFDNFKHANKGVMKKINDELDKREYNIFDIKSDQQDVICNSNSSSADKKNIHNRLNEGEVKGRPWTEEEQDLLEKTLVKYPPSIAIKERLKLIAAEIPTRNVDEIVARLKQIRAKILAQKVGK